MNTKRVLIQRSRRHRFPAGLTIVVICCLAIASLIRGGFASTEARDFKERAGASQDFAPTAAETCASATVISPASLPFTENATTEGAVNDIDPGFGSCAPGGGPDVVYSFTPGVTDVYTAGVTPGGFPSFDISLYIVTDCANPATTCVGGANLRGLAKSEVVSVTLTAGTRYFVVVDSPQFGASGTFHFSLRRGTPANDDCASPVVIDPSRLPFVDSATTFGATNDLNPGEDCLRTNQSANGPEVVYQITSADSQNYDVTVTPMANFDPTVYIVTSCSSLSSCTGADFAGNGGTETLRRNLTSGTTYFIVVDGSGDVGDFTISLVPTLPRAPDAPTELSATAVSSTQVNLSWVDNSNNEIGFRIERSLNGFSFVEIASVGANVTTFSDNTATPNTLFFYRVLSFNNFGNSDPSNIAFAQTPPIPIPQNPVIGVDPTTVDFGSVNVGQSDSRTITVSNGGAADLIISAISDPTGAFSIVNKPSLPLTIASMQSITLTVRFSPAVTGPAGSSFTIQSNDPTAPVVTVNLLGNGAGMPVPNLDVTPSIVDFGTSTTPLMLDLKNTGNTSLLISSLFRPAAPFTVIGGTFPATVMPGDKITLTVTFSPTSIGVFTGGLTIVSNDPDTTLLFIPIKGTSLTVPPVVAGLQFVKKGLRFRAAGSNVVSGAVLIVDSTETFTLELDGDVWKVGKKTRSTPGNRRVRDIFVSPSTHSVVVRNPNGGTSAPVSISV